MDVCFVRHAIQLGDMGSQTTVSLQLRADGALHCIRTVLPLHMDNKNATGGKVGTAPREHIETAVTQHKPGPNAYTLL